MHQDFLPEFQEIWWCQGLQNCYLGYHDLYELDEDAVEWEITFRLESNSGHSFATAKCTQSFKFGIHGEQASVA